MVEELYAKLKMHFLQTPLGAAGQFVSFEPDVKLDAKDLGTMILNVHTTGAEKTQMIGSTAWSSIPKELKDEMAYAGIGFAVRQI